MIAVYTGIEPKRRRKRPKAFLSYRRLDSADVTGRLYDRFADALGSRRIIHDVHSIPPGVDFRDFIEAVIPTCTVMLVIIGPDWMPAPPRKAARRSKPVKEDLVRLEIMCALEHGIPVIPVLVRGAKLPTAQSLPRELRGLLRRNAVRLREDPHFRGDADRLIAHIR